MIQQRRVPVRAWQSCGVWAVFLCLLPAAGCLFALGSIRDASNTLAAAGIVLAVLAAAIIAFMFLKMKRVQVDASARAKVVRRSKEPINIGGGGPNFIDLLLNVAAWSYLQARPSYEHTVFFVFEVSGTGGDRHKVTLAAKVSKDLYERYKPGAMVGVEYAAADPSFAVLEGERAYAGEDVFERGADARQQEMAAIDVQFGVANTERLSAAEESHRPDTIEARGTLAGIICGILASIVGVLFSTQTMIGFTESAPMVCIPIAAIYSVPLGIGGARLGGRIGVTKDGEANLAYSDLGAVAGGIFGLGISLMVMKFIEMLGQ